MEKFQNKYRIQSGRMPGWDYSRGGKYFVTLLTRKRICCFGDVANGKMLLNDMGKTINDLWMKIPEHFENTWLDEFVVMPNHIHGIIVMKRLIVSKNNDVRNGNNGYVETRLIASLHTKRFLHTKRSQTNQYEKQPGGITGKNNPMLSNDSLGKIIRWYKGRCSYEFGKMGHGGWFDWQPRFHDHIIRNDAELNSKRQYIKNNPGNWTNDEHNTG